MNPLTDREAGTIMAALTSMLGQWDEATIHHWLSRLQRLERMEAIRAAELLVDSWSDPRRPPWGSFYEIYLRERQRSAAMRPVLTSGGERVSLAEHLRRLEADGGEDAVAELKRWRVGEAAFPSDKRRGPKQIDWREAFR